MRGDRLAGFIYGTIVVLSVIVAGAKAFPNGMGHIAALVVITVLVFWLAHVYAFSLGDSVSKQEHLTVAEVTTIARREASLVYSAVPSVVVLLLGELGVLSSKAAIWGALGVGLAVLAVQGVLFARIERLGWIATLVVVTVNVSLGLVLIGLKVLVGNSH
jgi:hypothetical protein